MQQSVNKEQLMNGAYVCELASVTVEDITTDLTQWTASVEMFVLLTVIFMVV